MTLANIHPSRTRCDFFLATITIAFLPFALGGCPKGQKESEPIVTVQTTPAQKAEISQKVSADAVVFPVEQAIVAPKITAPVVDFKVQRGSRVKRGQLLAVLENKDLAGQAESSKGDFDQADATYALTVNSGLPQQIQKAELDAAAAQAAFDAQQKVYDSRKELFQQGALPRRDLDSAEVALVQARSANQQAQKLVEDLHRLGKEQQLKAARGTKESFEGKYRTAAAQLSYSEIRSPIDGVVTDRPLYVGDIATANQPILTVMNTSRLIAKAHIPQSDAATLKVGNPAELKVTGVDDPIPGRVSLVSPALDPGSTTIEVWVEARKPDPALKPGMTVSVSMTAKTAKEAIGVPTAAVFKTSEGADYVLVAGSDNKAHQKTVQIGVHNKDFTQIVSGVNAGDPVITSGGYAVPDGTQIQIEKPGAEDKGAADAGDKDDPKPPKSGSATKATPKDKD
jgi:multidrug efflux pump subunit AcrA (membrane-fusion protein)